MKTDESRAKDHKTVGGIIVASAMVAFLAIGCGKSTEQASNTAEEGAIASARSSATSEPAGDISTAAVAAATVPGTAEGSTSAESQIQYQSDTLPPEVAASATEVPVMPGSVVEITAEGSGDVTSIVLTDGLGQKVPFAYDAGASVWRVQYRVPIRAHTDRLGFSVTATNSANRFKRVWIFLNVQGGEAPDAKSDSGC